MRFFLIFIVSLFLQSCAGGKKINGSVKLISASHQTFIGGKERNDGKTVSTTYKFIFENYKNTVFNGAWIDGNYYKVEQFEYKNQYYVTVVIYPNAELEDFQLPLPIKSNAKVVLAYVKNGKQRYIEQNDFEKKETISGV